MTARIDSDTEPAAALGSTIAREGPIRSRLEELLGPAPDWSATLVHALVLSFLDRAAEYCGSLADAIGQQDAAAVARDSHSLKGMASNLGADELAAVSDTLETRARMDQLASAPRLLVRLRAELDAVRPAMQSVAGLSS